MATIRRRVEALEGGARRDVVDVAAETAAYGEQLWTTSTGRAYLNAAGDTLTVIGAGGVVRYEVPGTDLREVL